MPTIPTIAVNLKICQRPSSIVNPFHYPSLVGMQIETNRRGRTRRDDEFFMMRDGASQQRQSHFVVRHAESIPEFLYPHAHIHLESEAIGERCLMVGAVHRKPHNCLQ